MDIEEDVRELVFTSDIERKIEIFETIREEASELGIFTASIHNLYRARGRGEIGGGFTVPAINLRTLTYDLARVILRVARKLQAGAFILELARTEMVYTMQPPVEYAGVCLAAAITEGWRGPLFIQGDHFQINLQRYREDPEREIGDLKALIKNSLAAGFYNIDIDSSTLVDLSKKDLKEQQKLNFGLCAELTKFIREHQPDGIEVSVGGEIGEIGGKNSTPEELIAFMDGYLEVLGSSLEGISKISVQTGTTHGGVVLPDGSIAEVKLDFDTLATLSKLARERYRLAGAVQHGASTLPDEVFHRFPEVETAEIHLATQFQNIVFEHLPRELKNRMYAWVKENYERSEDQTEEQFIYTTRKKALGHFKTELMELPPTIKGDIVRHAERKFTFLFEQLNIGNTMPLVNRYVSYA